MQELKILSLIPAATEIIYLLGLENNLVGVSHECDFPGKARSKPKVTSSPISNSLSSLQINTEVAKLKHKSIGVFHINSKLLSELKPDLILTQELCDVCAISWTEVKKAARILELRDKNQVLGENIISLEPESIGDILDNIKLIGDLCRESYKAKGAIKGLKKRLASLNSKFMIHNSKKPKVLVLEWLDPIMIAGHWVPEMIERAGGVNLITKIGQKSFPITIDKVVEAKPDIVVIAPCGFNIQRTLEERGLISKYLYKICDRMKNTSLKVYLIDGNSYLTRPGPRIIDGIEILAEILHPEIFPKKHKNSAWQEFV